MCLAQQLMKFRKLNSAILVKKCNYTLCINFGNHSASFQNSLKSKGVNHSHSTLRICFLGYLLQRTFNDGVSDHLKHLCFIVGLHQTSLSLGPCCGCPKSVIEVPRKSFTQSFLILPLVTSLKYSSFKNCDEVFPLYVTFVL